MNLQSPQVIVGIGSGPMVREHISTVNRSRNLTVLTIPKFGLLLQPQLSDAEVFHFASALSLDYAMVC